MCCAKTDEPIVGRFGGQTYMGPRNRVLDGYPQPRITQRKGHGDVAFRQIILALDNFQRIENVNIVYFVMQNVNFIAHCRQTL